MSKEEKNKVYYPDWSIEDKPFPKLISYKNLLVKPEELKDINKIEGVKLAGIESGAMNLANHDSDDLPEGAINKYLFDGAVTEIKLAGQAVTNAKIAVNAIQGAVIAAGAITETKIGNLAISTPKIQVGAIDAGKIATGAVTAIKILSGAITTEKIDAYAVTSAKVTTGQLITLSAQIKNAIITTAKIGDAQVTNLKIANDLNANKITVGTLTAIKMQTAPDGNFRVELKHAGYHHYLTWWNAANSLLSWITDSGAGQLLLNGPSGVGLSYNGNARFLASNDCNMSAVNLIPGVSVSYDLGTSVYYWRDVFLKYLKFNSSYGKIYHGATALQDFYSYQTKFLTRIRLNYLSSDPTANKYCGQMFFQNWEATPNKRRPRCADGDNNFRDLCYYDERNAGSPIPTFASGIEQLKKIKAPTILKKEGLCFNTRAFPEEFQLEISGKKNKKRIDLKPVIGMLIKGQKEILEKVENLELK